MALEVIMPRAGYEMTEGTVVRWLKAEGDSVEAGEVIAEIETDKATLELEAHAPGMLRSIVVAEGETVPVGDVLAYVGAPDEPLPERRHAPQPTESRLVRESRPGTSPVARRLAIEHNTDLSSVTGTGPRGRITKDDVLAAVEAGGTEARPAGLRAGFPSRRPDAQGKIYLGPMGQAIARRTEATMRETPHFYLTVRIDMTEALEYRRDVNAKAAREERVSLNDLVLKACALALHKYPVYNSTFEGDHLQVQPHVNLGIALALPDGLLVPAVLECELKSLTEIARDAKDVLQRARHGTLRQAEYTGTFTLSNLGMFEVDSFTAIIVSPQVGVLALGSVHPTPWVKDGAPIVRQMMSATLSTDHRVASGTDAAQFAGEIKRLLEDPRLLGTEAA